MNIDKPNIKIAIGEFYKLQFWKDVKCIFPTHISVPEIKLENKTKAQESFL